MHETYATLLNKKLVVPSQKTAYMAVDRNYFATVLAPSLTSVHVDEDWYLSHSPDVKEAIARQEFASAQDHYAKVGFYEHRMPYEIDVDESWYNWKTIPISRRRWRRACSVPAVRISTSSVIGRAAFRIRILPFA